MAHLLIFPHIYWMLYSKNLFLLSKYEYMGSIQVCGSVNWGEKDLLMNYYMYLNSYSKLEIDYNQSSTVVCNQW